MLSSILDTNFILSVDGYKLNHWAEMPLNKDGTIADIFVQSAIVPRKIPYYSFDGKIVAMGQTLVSQIIYNTRITVEMIDEAEIETTNQGYEFNRAGWEYIVANYDGYLPLRVDGVPEGTLIDPQTPVITFINTDPKVGWLPSYLENWAQGIVWVMSEDATLHRKGRSIFRELMIETGSDLNYLDYKIHNFGDRGARSPEEAPVLSGISHAALFNGSDCARVNRYIKAIYGSNNNGDVYTTSIEAFEHTTTMLASDVANKDDFGAAVRAVERLEAVVARTKRGIGIPLISVPIDTYDSERFAAEYIGERLRERIIASGGTLVGRPDSGDIYEEPGKIGRIFAEKFGTTVNSKGYNTLHPAIAVIQGDGVNIETTEGIVRAYITTSGNSLDGFVVGMGGGATNWTKRDDASFSQKATAYSFDGEHWFPLLKDPITDRKKKSISGLVFVDRDNVVRTVLATAALVEGTLFEDNPNWVNYYSNRRELGRSFNRDNFDVVRTRARAGL